MARTSLEALEKRNKFLEDELQTLRDLFQNLNSEKDLENPDQRRAFMLKAQNYQLERQCMLLAQAQSNRASVLTEIECQLQNIIFAFKSIVSEEKSGPDVTIKRSEVMGYLGNLKKLKHSLYKQSQLESSDSLRIPSLMTGSKFAKSHKAIDCADIFKTKTENLNMKHIADLEQELSSLRKRLSALSFLLRSLNFTESFDDVDVGKHLFNPWMKKVNFESEKSVSDLEQCSDKLLALTLLHPSAPWSAMKKSSEFETIKYDKTMQSLPLSVQKNATVRSTVKELCRAHKYAVQQQQQQIDVMEKHLEYQRETTKIQSQYLTQFTGLLLKNYESWKDEVVNGICQPVSKLMQSWSALKGDQSGTNLKQFFNDFKNYETDLENVACTVSSDTTGGLFESLNECLKKSLRDLAEEYKIEIDQVECALKHEPCDSQ